MHIFKELQNIVRIDLFFWMDLGLNTNMGERIHGWGLKGKKIVNKVNPRRPPNIDLLPAMTINGYLACSILQGSFDRETFLEFIEAELIPPCTLQKHCTTCRKRSTRSESICSKRAHSCLHILCTLISSSFLSSLPHCLLRACIYAIRSKCRFMRYVLPKISEKLHIMIHNCLSFGMDGDFIACIYGTP